MNPFKSFFCFVDEVALRPVDKLWDLPKSKNNKWLYLLRPIVLIFGTLVILLAGAAFITVASLVVILAVIVWDLLPTWSPSIEKTGLSIMISIIIIGGSLLIGGALKKTESDIDDLKKEREALKYKVKSLEENLQHRIDKIRNKMDKSLEDLEFKVLLLKGNQAELSVKLNDLKTSYDEYRSIRGS